MITIFYKLGDDIVYEVDEDLLDTIAYSDLLWVDLVDATHDQREKVEQFFDISLQTRQQTEEIESSSRYAEMADRIIANSNFLIGRDDAYESAPTSFILKDNVLISTRKEALRTFGDTMRKLRYNPKAFPTGYHVLVALFETRIDLDADMAEDIAKKISEISGQLNVARDGDDDEENIYRISALQESTMLMRENITDKQRVISSISRSNRFPEELAPKLAVMLKDINSLLNHTDFSFSRLDFLQDAYMSLTNIRLSRVTKTFTVISVIFMPPTLIASVYGMNFSNIPELQWEHGYLFSWGLMVAAALVVLLIFKYKKLL